MAQIHNAGLLQSITIRKILEKDPACFSLALWRHKTREVVCRHRRTESGFCMNSWEMTGTDDAQYLRKHFSGVVIAR